MKNSKNVLLTCLVLIGLALGLAVFAGGQEVEARTCYVPTYVTDFYDYLVDFNPWTATQNDWNTYYNWINSIDIVYGSVVSPYYWYNDAWYYYDVPLGYYRPLSPWYGGRYSTWYSYYPNYYSWVCDWYTPAKLSWYHPGRVLTYTQPIATTVTPVKDTKPVYSSNAPAGSLISASLASGASGYDVIVNYSQNSNNIIAGNVEARNSSTMSYDKNVGKIKVVAYGFNDGVAFVMQDGVFQVAPWQQVINNTLMFTVNPGQAFKVVR